MTVSEMLVAYQRFSDRHYRDRDGNPTLEHENMIDAAKPLRRLYSATPTAEFGRLSLRAVRDEMVAGGLARTTVNARVNRVRRIVKWAASPELIRPSVPVALATVTGLQEGPTESRN